MRRIAVPLRRRGWGAGAPIFVIGAVVGLFTVLAGLPGAASNQVSTRIIPGASIGPARLGMTSAAAAAALGPSAALGGSGWSYPRYGVTVDLESDVVVRIATSAPKYRTVDGAGVGIAEALASGLVGDVNSVTTISGPDTTVVYMFQGIGFVFRAGRAIEAFVVAPLPFGLRGSSFVSARGGLSIAVPGGPPVPPAGSPGPAMSAPPGGAAAPPSGAASAALRDVTANVLAVGGLSVAGTVVNTGTVPLGPVTVDATFTVASGDQVDMRTIIQGPIAPEGDAPFLVQAAMVGGIRDIIVRYQVAVTGATGTLLAATSAQPIPASAYAEFMRRQIHIRIDLGAPANGTGPPAVQAIVSIADTGVIPPQWVQQATVVIPYTTNGVAASQTVQIRPGETQTVIVPAPPALGQPEVTDVVLSGQ